jgi:hypothetical protein
LELCIAEKAYTADDERGGEEYADDKEEKE